MLSFGKQVTGTLSVLDVSGKVIMTDQIINQEKWVNDNTLENGVYFIRLDINNEGSQIMKMIVE